MFGGDGTYPPGVLAIPLSGEENGGGAATWRAGRWRIRFWCSSTPTMAAGEVPSD